MDIERDLLGAVVRDGNLKPLLEANVQTKDFQTHASVFDFVRTFYMTHGTVPTFETVDGDYPGSLDAEEPVEPLTYYVEEMVSELQFRLLYNGLSEAAGAIDEPDIARAEHVRLAVGRLTETIRAVSETGGTLSAVDIADRGPSWWAAYIASEQQRQGIPPGRIPLGIPAIDASMRGMRKENLVTMFGLPKSGKSLMLLRAAIEAHKWGYRPMFISFEMSVEEQEERYHALRAAVSMTRMQQGRLRNAEKVKVERSMRYVSNLNKFIIAEDPQSMTTVSALSAHIDNHSPDAVYVDGTYMMEDELGEAPNSAQALTNITRALKRLAQAKKVPVVITTQALEWKTSKRDGVGTGSIGYSSSFLQDSDTVIGIDSPDAEIPQRKRYKVLATRVGMPLTVTYDWDWDHTGVLYEVEHAPEEDVFTGANI